MLGEPSGNRALVTLVVENELCNLLRRKRIPDSVASEDEHFVLVLRLVSNIVHSHLQFRIESTVFLTEFDDSTMRSRAESQKITSGVAVM
jgi:hypothetical protein